MKSCVRVNPIYDKRYRHAPRLNWHCWPSMPEDGSADLPGLFFYGGLTKDIPKLSSFDTVIESHKFRYNILCHAISWPGTVSALYEG